MAGFVGQEAGAVLGQVQEDLQKLDIKVNTNLKRNVEAVDITDLETAPERTELGLKGPSFWCFSKTAYLTTSTC